MPYDIKGILKRAVPAYKEGARIADLAVQFKISKPYLYTLLQSSGIKMRPPGADQRKVLDEEAIVAEYLSGISILELATTHQVARGSILTRLRERKIKIRSASEQSYISASRQSPEERKARAAAAHAAVRGSKRSPTLATALAIRKQVAGKMTVKEKSRYDALLIAGIVTVPQFAVGKYSVDLAIPDARIAIEVKSGWSSFGRKGEQEAAKKADLKRWGWLMIDMQGTEWHPGWVQKVRMYIEQRRAMRLA